jgi:hypothetical protein
MPTVDLNSPDGADKIARILEKRTTDLMRMATFEFNRQVAISTPRKTGRAGNAWMPTVNAPSDEVLPEGNYPIPVPRDIPPVKSVSDVIYITNNTPYIGKLNDGYSKQAPARFVELAAAKVQVAVSKIWAKIK